MTTQGGTLFMELSEATHYLLDHAGERAIAEDPPLAELVHESRRLILVVWGSKTRAAEEPSEELLRALAAAHRTVKTRGNHSSNVHRLLVAAERCLVNCLKHVPAPRANDTKLAGYDGTACGECGNFTVRLKATCRGCDTCGRQEGCS